MRKINCPHCGVVNLEEFVTYPHCAGCGVRISQEADKRESFLRRPVATLLWVSVLGALAVLLLMLAPRLEKQPEQMGRAVIHGNTSRQVNADELVYINLIVDGLGEPQVQRKAPLRGVKIRMPWPAFDSFRFIELDPKPEAIVSHGKGRYFEYGDMERNTSIMLTLRALRPGEHQLHFVIYADGHQPGEFYSRVKVKTKPSIQ